MSANWNGFVKKNPEKRITIRVKVKQNVGALKVNHEISVD